LDGDAAWRERVAGEVDVDRVGGGVVGDPHVPIVPCRSASSLVAGQVGQPPLEAPQRLTIRSSVSMNSSTSVTRLLSK
jgi:hypothetical protein